MPLPRYSVPFDSGEPQGAGPGPTEAELRALIEELKNTNPGALAKGPPPRRERIPGMQASLAKVSPAAGAKDSKPSAPGKERVPGMQAMLSRVSKTKQGTRIPGLGLVEDPEPDAETASMPPPPMRSKDPFSSAAPSLNPIGITGRQLAGATVAGAAAPLLGAAGVAGLPLALGSGAISGIGANAAMGGGGSLGEVVPNAMLGAGMGLIPGALGAGRDLLRRGAVGPGEALSSRVAAPGPTASPPSLATLRPPPGAGMPPNQALNPPAPRPGPLGGGLPSEGFMPDEATLMKLRAPKIPQVKGLSDDPWLERVFGRPPARGFESGTLPPELSGASYGDTLSRSQPRRGFYYSNDPSRGPSMPAGRSGAGYSDFLANEAPTIQNTLPGGPLARGAVGSGESTLMYPPMQTGALSNQPVRGAPGTMNTVLRLESGAPIKPAVRGTTMDTMLQLDPVTRSLPGATQQTLNMRSPLAPPAPPPSASPGVSARPVNYSNLRELWAAANAGDNIALATLAGMGVLGGAGLGLGISRAGMGGPDSRSPMAGGPQMAPPPFAAPRPNTPFALPRPDLTRPGAERLSPVDPSLPGFQLRPPPKRKRKSKKK